MHCGYCCAGTGLGSLFPVKQSVKGTAYKDQLCASTFVTNNGCDCQVFTYIRHIVNQFCQIFQIKFLDCLIWIKTTWFSRQVKWFSFTKCFFCPLVEDRRFSHWCLNDTWECRCWWVWQASSSTPCSESVHCVSIMFPARWKTHFSIMIMVNS